MDVDDSPGERLAGEIREIQSMDYAAIAKILPLLPADTWKFAPALPESLFREMVVADHYYCEDFLQTLRPLAVSTLPVKKQERPEP